MTATKHVDRRGEASRSEPRVGRGWVAVALIPAAAVHFGGRAAGHGDLRGLLPLGIGALAGVGVTILSVAGLVT